MPRTEVEEALRRKWLGQFVTAKPKAENDVPLIPSRRLARWSHDGDHGVVCDTLGDELLRVLFLDGAAPYFYEDELVVEGSYARAHIPESRLK